jgi:type IV secretory pathway VirB6-like protein
MSDRALLILGALFLLAGGVPVLSIHARLLAPDYSVLIFLILPVMMIGASIILLATFKMLLMRLLGFSSMNATLCWGVVGLAQYFLGLYPILDASTELFSVVLAWCTVALVVASVVSWWLNVRNEHERR